MTDQIAPARRGPANAGLMVDRSPQSVFAEQLPPGLRVVSADNHIEVTEDIFHKAFPERLRAQAPRVWRDGYWRVGYRDAMQTYPEGVDIDGALTRAVLTDGFDMAQRGRHLEAEGIACEIVYPQSLMAFIRHPDHEVQELIYRTWNEWMAELGRRDPGRFFGVAICPNWWDPDRAESAVAQVAELGLKSLMLPLNPGLGADGKPIDYAAPVMDRFWTAVAETGLPIAFHIGEVPGNSGRGGFGTFFLTQAAPFRKVLGNLIFGGILDRHPGLQVIFAEGGINWVAGALQDAELTFGAHREIFDYVPRMRPTEYWRRNLYATFQTDAVGLAQLHLIGADRVMWAQDYPHGEGTFGYTADAMAEVVAAAGPDDARLILGETATRVYGLDR